MFSPVLRAVTSWRRDDVRNCATDVSDAYSGAPVGTPTLDYLSPLKLPAGWRISTRCVIKRFRREGGCFFGAAKRKGQLKRKGGSRTPSCTRRCSHGLVLRARRSQSRASLGLGRKRGSRNCSVVTKLYVYVILVGKSSTHSNARTHSTMRIIRLSSKMLLLSRIFRRVASAQRKKWRQCVGVVTTTNLL